MNSNGFALKFYFEIKNLHVSSSFSLVSISMSCYLYEIANHPNVTLYNQAPWNVLGLWDYKKIEHSLWTSLEIHSNKLEWWHDKGWEPLKVFLMYSQDDFKVKSNIGLPTSQNILHYIIKMLSKLWIWQIFLFLPSSLFLSHFVFVKIKRFFFYDF